MRTRDEKYTGVLLEVGPPPRNQQGDVVGDSTQAIADWHAFTQWKLELGDVLRKHGVTDEQAQYKHMIASVDDFCIWFNEKRDAVWRFK